MGVSEEKMDMLSETFVACFYDVRHSGAIYFSALQRDLIAISVS